VNVAVVIPALNEAGNIRALVAEVRATIHAEVIVVDNGSTDATAGEARAATDCAEVVIFLDGDYSFLPVDLPDLLRPIAQDHADLVLGSRWLGSIEPGAMPPPQRFGNWLTARLMNRLYGLSITDRGPYRAIRRT